MPEPKAHLQNPLLCFSTQHDWKQTAQRIIRSLNFISISDREYAHRASKVACKNGR